MDQVRGVRRGAAAAVRAGGVLGQQVTDQSTISSQLGDDLAVGLEVQVQARGRGPGRDLVARGASAAHWVLPVTGPNSTGSTERSTVAVQP
jgi:hypothetical protein